MTERQGAADYVADVLETAHDPRESMTHQAERTGNEDAGARQPLERFFARVSDDPLADAFAGAGTVHPFVGMTPVPDADVAEVWHRVMETPRAAPGVAYVHVPFCENHCLFCGFYQNPWRSDAGAAYVDAVLKHLEKDAGRACLQGPPLRAVYLGGGTPTTLAASDVARLVEGLRRALPLAGDCEITLEGRVVSFDGEKARAAFDAGVNRLSIGIQSFDDGIRRSMGRKAGKAEVIRFLEDLVRADRAAVIVDLIYGLPGQSLEDFAADVGLAADLGLDGFDLYALNLISRAPLASAIARGKHRPVPRQDLGRYYAAGSAVAARAGFEPITTSHWRRGARERNLYNAAIKSGADCLAYGAGGGAFLAGHSFRHTADLSDYEKRAGTDACLAAGMVRMSPLAPVHNAVKAGMEEGFLDPVEPTQYLAGLGGGDFVALTAPLLGQWCEAGLMERSGRVYCLTLAGRFWQVAMTGRLLAWLEEEAGPSLRAPAPQSPS
ncbi:oxygen-independent coproporphyrinogen-3 oxidase [Rhodobium orientis]|nr:heme anaerobic degradation radical SAM methyltransferase ChuW/HutW [Rhodobium orientis]MBB4303195.1 oxygen-independent coproporphyrinogen-3 oxidase [Rhodobium orientis]